MKRSRQEHWWKTKEMPSTLIESKESGINGKRTDIHTRRDAENWKIETFILSSQNRRRKTMGKFSSKRKTLSGRTPSGKRSRRSHRPHEWECTNHPLCDFLHPPVFQNDKTESGCSFAEKWVLMHREVDSQLAMDRKRIVVKVVMPFSKNSKQLGCAFQDTEPPKSNSILRKDTKYLGPKRSVEFSKEVAHHTVLMSAVFTLWNLRTCLKKKPWRKNDASAETRGKW